jgi:D-aminopeptidase
LRFHQVVDAEVVSLLPGMERPSGNVVVFQGRDMVEVARLMDAITNMNQVRP